MHQLMPARRDQAPVLYPVVNVALNVTATENLAWQERKAEPFILTPLYCGSGMLAARRRAGGRRTGRLCRTRVMPAANPISA